MLLSGAWGPERSKPEVERGQTEIREADTKAIEAALREMPTKGFEKCCCFLCDKILIFYLFEKLQ